MKMKRIICMVVAITAMKSIVGWSAPNAQWQQCFGYGYENIDSTNCVADKFREYWCEPTTVTVSCTREEKVSTGQIQGEHSASATVEVEVCVEGEASLQAAIDAAVALIKKLIPIQGDVTVSSSYSAGGKLCAKITYTKVSDCVFDLPPGNCS